MPKIVKRDLNDGALNVKLSQIELLVCDVDGVLTDGGIYILEESELKRFHVTDGLAQRAAQKVGLKIAWVTARPSKVTEKRAKELDTDFLVQTKHGKVPAVDKIRSELGLVWADVCFIGDDLVDLAVMKKVGVAVAPTNGCDEAKALAHYVTEKPGGKGAVRELIEKILKAQGKWGKVVAEIAR
ncbi:MAG: hypothetical protein CMO80_10785 [Verrucomicrobiales bacterium]|nr:hypothetical protein [Verrucomicrobiales bacterium]|tara:strand:- start:177 stop:728 length:552 start_codon:yes stop_codon:yes gene_type:complete